MIVTATQQAMCGWARYRDAETGEELLYNRRSVAGPVTVMQKQETNCYTTGDVWLGPLP
jgi:hypothetical protein